MAFGELSVWVMVTHEEGWKHYSPLIRSQLVFEGVNKFEAITKDCSNFPSDYQTGTPASLTSNRRGHQIPFKVKIFCSPDPQNELEEKGL